MLDAAKVYDTRPGEIGEGGTVAERHGEHERSRR